MRISALVLSVALFTACLGEGGSAETDDVDDAYPCEGELPTQDVEVQSVDAYTYNGDSVILVQYGCCDFFDEVVNTSTCELVCAPSGGFSGNGDGQCPDFEAQATHEGQLYTAD